MVQINTSEHIVTQPPTRLQNESKTLRTCTKLMVLLILMPHHLPHQAKKLSYMKNLVLEEAVRSGVLTVGTLDTLLSTTDVFESMPTKIRTVA